MLAWSLAAHRWRSLVGTFVALALGIGLLAATAVVIASSSAQPPQRYADAAVLVAAPQSGEDSSGYPEFTPWSQREAGRLAGELAQIDGVRVAVADRDFHGQLVADGRLVTAAEPEDPQGHTWSSTALGGYRLVDGAAPRGSGQVAVDAAAGLRPGDVADLLTAAGARTVTVTGTLDGPGIYLADEAAAELSSGSRAIGVVLEAGADVAPVAERATAIVGGVGTVHWGEDRARMESEADARDRWVGAQLLGLMGALAAFVTVFVVATTFAFVVTQRRREIGLLRVVGATPRQIRRMLLGEALAVGLVASLAGAVLGAALAPVLGGWMVEAGMQPRGWETRSIALPVAGSVVVGLVVALLGVWSASRRATRVRPLEALRESVVERRPMTTGRWVLGVGGLGGGIALAALASATESTTSTTLATGAVAGLITGLTLLAPVYVPWAVRGLCRPFDAARGATVELVREGAAAGVRRMASTTAPVLLTVGFAVLVTGLIETMDQALGAGTAADLPAETVIAPSPGSPGLSDAAVAAVADVGPRRLLAPLPTGIVVGGRRLDAVGLGATALAEGAPSVLSGDFAGLDAIGAVAVTRTVASAHGWEPGSEFDVTWTDGVIGSAHVAAVVADDAAPAPVLLTREVARAHDPAALTPVAYADGVDPALGARLAPLAADALSRTDYQAAGEAEEERLVRLFVLVLLGLALGFTGLAIANTLVMATGDRRRDFAVLRLSGAAVGQVLRVVAVEAVLVVVIGSALGVAVALPALLGIASGLSDDTGVDVGVRLAWPVVLAVIATCLAIALAASVLPARHALRRPPTDPARDRE